jgi:sigma-B regulation protein RsbU (phosphoserine phosphatase)
MDSPGTKQQINSGGTMATTEISYLRNELEVRRQRLLDASSTQPGAGSLQLLLDSVDAALSRIDKGTFGICEQCHDTIEADRLICDPLVRFCLDHLSKDEQRALENDLQMAARIQRTLLPRADWAIDGWQARYHYQPSNMVSGDYCDLIETEGGFLFLLGDVAGKGVAASMLMSHLHATFRILAGQHLQLPELMEHANRLFCESTTAGQFATLIVGCGRQDGRVEYVSAGHLPLFHLSPKGVESHDATGVPLGMFATSHFPVCRAKLETGDKLLLFTDGLTETSNVDGKEYGIARVRDLALRHASSEPHELVQACLDEARAFSPSAKRADDLTVMVLHRT